VLFPSPQYISIVIIGGGHAGLSAAYCLRRRGVDDYVIFEKKQIGQSWRSERWDSFSLVTPNHQCRLPGHPYEGDDPEGFMTKDQIVDHLERYARKFKPPILENVTVTAITKREGFYHITTDQGNWFCDDVIVAVGSYHTPFIPAGAEKIPAHIQQFHAANYKGPSQIGEGETLIVGSGQSGVQVMEDLHLQGRKVHLCLGNTLRSPRRYRGKDAVTWLEEMGDFKTPFAAHPDQTRALANTDHYVTGRDGGREIDLRKFALEGVKLYGFLDDIDSTKFSIRQDLGAKLDAADEFYNSICQRIDDYINEHQIEAPEQPHYSPVWAPEAEVTELDFAEQNITSIIWCMGFLPDFSFIKLPVFNMRGFPETDRGVTALPGLYFLGLPWQHTWGSARLSGIAEDADFIAAKIEASIPQSVER
jgi:putative flavoprotein involved in K+ transport